MKDPIGWRLVRWLYAAFYLASGIYICLTALGITPPPGTEASTAYGAFQDALAKTGFIMPTLGATYIAAGFSLFLYRSAPLGIVLLAPPMVVIFLTNILLTSPLLGPGLIWGCLHAGILVALAWHFRAAFPPLWNYSTASARQVRHGA